MCATFLRNREDKNIEKLTKGAEKKMEKIMKNGISALKEDPMHIESIAERNCKKSKNSFDFREKQFSYMDSKTEITENQISHPSFGEEMALE